MKLNPEYTLFDGNMFVQMRGLLADVSAPASLDMLDLSIGEPQVTGGALLGLAVAPRSLRGRAPEAVHGPTAARGRWEATYQE